MLTRDLERIEWKHSKLEVCSFADSAFLLRLMKAEGIPKALLLAQLESRHLEKLYSSPSALNGARQMRSLGRRVLKDDVEPYVEGHYQNSLRRVLKRFPQSERGKTWNRKDLIKALLELC